MAARWLKFQLRTGREWSGERGARAGQIGDEVERPGGRKR